MTDAPTYQQFLDAARATGDRAAYDSCLTTLIQVTHPTADSRADADDVTMMCRRAAWLAVGQWRVRQETESDGSPPAS